MAKQLPLGRLAGRSDHGNNAKLLPELSDGTNNGRFSGAVAQSMLELRDRSVARFELLVGLYGQLRNGARTGQLWIASPIAIASEGIHIRQNPGGYNKVRLLTGLALKIEPDGDAFNFQAYQQLFGRRDLSRVWSRIWLSGNCLNKRRRN